LIYEISANQDLKITIDATEEGKEQNSEIMLINGQRQWMLVKNLPLEKGSEIDALDAPVLSLKLVLELLRVAAPAGPNGLNEKATFNVHEQTRSISVNTASANGGLEAPWALQGTIEPTTTGQMLFELAAKHNATMHLSGTWQKDAIPASHRVTSRPRTQVVFSIGPMKTTGSKITSSVLGKFEGSVGRCDSPDFGAAESFSMCAYTWIVW